MFNKSSYDNLTISSLYQNKIIRLNTLALGIKTNILYLSNIS